ncbi:MAG TPA: SCO family protein [Chthoniobacterales bacterium]|nr:SCO family protein [Chthoniobacterales bacterium]
MKSRLAIILSCFVFLRPMLGLTPGDLSRAKFQQHPGQQISRALEFQNDGGHAIRFGDLLTGRPLILVPGYFRCPMLCTMINDGLINSLENLRASVGIDFDVVDISIDPNESAQTAAQKKALYVRRYGRSGSASGWHCLVGNQKAIAQFTDEIGYRYAYDPEVKEYAHPSGVVVVTPDGRISQYVLGVTFSSTELRDALTTAREGKSKSVVSEILLLCYHYNPITGKYGVLIMSVLRVASAGFVGLIGLWVFWMARTPHKRVAQSR